MRVHTEQLPDTIVATTGLARPLVEMTLRRLKEAGLITTGTRYAEPIGPIDVARILMGLAAMSATAAAAQCRHVGASPLSEGDAIEVTAEDALVALVEAAVGIRSRSYDLRSGEVRVGQTEPFLQVASRLPDRSSFLATYGSAPDANCVALTVFSIPSITKIAHELLRNSDV